MPKAIKRRTDKRQKEDHLQETVGDIRNKIKEKQRMLVLVLIVSLVVVTAVVSFFVFNKMSNDKALALEAEGQKIFYGDFQSNPMGPADRYKRALDLFKQSYAVKSRPHVLLYIANSNFELGNYDEAIKNLTELTKQSSEPDLVPLAYYKLAMAYLRKGDENRAVTTLNTLASAQSKNGALQDAALFESGKILETAGKAEEAKAKYQELLKRFPQSVFAEEAKKRAGATTGSSTKGQ